MQQEWIQALGGGVIIGLAVSVMLLFNGRATGISGILNGIFTVAKNDTSWRVFFVVGLIAGGLLLNVVRPHVFAGQLVTEEWTLVVAGLFVGFGTLLGSGCTSGHGVCGISRLSIRSIIATLTFIFAGVCAVFFFKAVGVLL